VSEPSIRERVSDIGKAMFTGDPPPSEVRKHEITLAGLLTVVNKALTGAQLAYNRRLALERVVCKSAADARLQADATDEFADLFEAKTTKESVMELLRTCRSFGRSLSDEMRMQK
jgi:hypothetical protein